MSVKISNGMPDAADASSVPRAAWMRVLAQASSASLAQRFDRLGRLPEQRWLRAPETGLAMVRGRAEGEGEQFNLGEVSITRCAVIVDEQAVGVAYVRGRDHRHARQAALADALLQLPHWHDSVQRDVIEPLIQEREAALRLHAQQTAGSRVDFFTLVRGEG